MRLRNSLHREHVDCRACDVMSHVRWAGKPIPANKALPMRRIVPSRIADALDRARPALEEYVGRHLEYPLGFPYKFAPAACPAIEASVAGTPCRGDG